MAKFVSIEAREYPTLAFTLDAGAVVDLPADTNVAGLVAQKDLQTPAPVAEPTPAADAAPADGKVSDNGASTQ